MENIMKKAWFCLMAVIMISSVNAQDKSDYKDTSVVLGQVIIRAYENNRKLVDVPASVSVITKAQFERFSNISLVPALNTTAGVRMEERSPGSYRLNIRGSSLRSPFGVRNVKVYYNNIPYTDPGGNTYFNQMGFYNVNSMEIIKGPGSSLYGAGTGGVILMNSDDPAFVRGGSVDYVNGSFGSNSIHVKINGGNENFHSTTNYQYQNSDGYRDHTKMERKVLTWDGTAKVGEKGVLRAHFLQGDLFYETPGALTLAEYNANPKMARPRVGQTPGSEEAHAAITQKLYLAGFDYSVKWNDEHFRSVSSMYGAYSKLTNPTTRNYEIRTEPHFGSRNMIEYAGNINSSKLTIQGGFEVQQEYTTSKVYKNKAGNPDTLQTDDQVTNKQMFAFLQATLELEKGWIFTAGGSLNLLKVDFDRVSFPSSNQRKKYNNEVAPRFAILKKITPSISAYGSIARGFSPPTTAELLPSTGVISTSLQAEHGWNFEGGLKGNLVKGKIFFDVNIFYFRLANTIAQRRDITGGDFFVNAGNTKQNGVESLVSYRVYDQNSTFVNHVKLWGAYTYSNFHYANFEKIAADTAILSGKRLPSIAPSYLSAGVDVTTKPGFYLNMSYYYSDPLPLNDANTAYASSYNLLNARIGFRKVFTEKMYADIFATGDNLFDVKYSLGNDINAVGNRYYNAAPGINYAVGVSVRYNW